MSRPFLPLPVLLGLLALLAAAAAQAQSLTELCTRLQASLQRSLERTMIDGALQHLDLRTGKVQAFYPTENHEMILHMGDIYVMCATLIGADGVETEVDYYMPPARGRFAVLRTEIGNRAPLRALMDAGKAVRLE